MLVHGCSLATSTRRWNERCSLKDTCGAGGTIVEWPAGMSFVRRMYPWTAGGGAITRVAGIRTCSRFATRSIVGAGGMIALTAGGGNARRLTAPMGSMGATAFQAITLGNGTLLFNLISGGVITVWIGLSAPRGSEIIACLANLGSPFTILGAILPRVSNGGRYSEGRKWITSAL